MRMVSIIVPFYEGNKYLNNLIKTVSENIKYLKDHGSQDTVELIIINDSPWYTLEIPVEAEAISYKVVCVSENGGIQKARVLGLDEANGDYILFLDQDDSVEASYIYRQLEVLGNNDVVVCNAKLMREDGTFVGRYSSDNNIKRVLNRDIYIYSYNQIVSPGQCIIKKSSIPNKWREKIIKKNGSDDLYLWLLMLSMNRKFILNNEMLYTHNYTGVNLSSSEKNMSFSTIEMVSFLDEKDGISKKKIKDIERSRNFDIDNLELNGCKKFVNLIKNLDIIIRRSIWKVRYM